MAYELQQTPVSASLRWPAFPQWHGTIMRDVAALQNGDGAVNVNLKTGECTTSFAKKPRTLPPLEVLCDFLGACSEVRL